MAADASFIVNLNVGGKRFSTTSKTLSLVPNSFLSDLISGRIQCLTDESGALFIDRDPTIFKAILNYLRTGDIDSRKVTLTSLKREAQFYGVTSLVCQLAAYEESRNDPCGLLLFCSRIRPPVFKDPLKYTETDVRLRRQAGQQVIAIVADLNCIAVAYSHCICVLKARSCNGWELVFTTPPLEVAPLHLALKVNVTSSSSHLGDKMLAASTGTTIRVWSCSPQPKLLTTFDMGCSINGLSFANNQLIAVNDMGKVAIWQSMQRHWQNQILSPIGCYFTSGSFLFLGCEKGSIDYIDTEKFPVRLKDNDLLVNQVFDDPHNEAITAISVYIPPTCGNDQSCMEVTYGTKRGGVKITRYPGNVRHASPLFQSYDVHAKSVSMVSLTERCLVSVCDANHVRAWSVTRVNGHISSDAGIEAIGSFTIASLNGSHPFYHPINAIGPFGEKDEEKVFVHRIVPNTDTIFVSHSATGHRICKVSSVDGSNISCSFVHRFFTDKNGKPRRLLFTGHSNGTLQLWDLNMAFEMYKNSPDKWIDGSLSDKEFFEMLKKSSTTPRSNSLHSLLPTPCPALLGAVYPEYKPLSSSKCIDTPIFASQSAFIDCQTSRSWSTRFIYSPKKHSTSARHDRPKSASDLLVSDELLHHSLRKADSDTAIDPFPGEVVATAT